MKTMENKIYGNGMEYILEADGCYYPNLSVESDEVYEIGKYGQMIAEYYWENRKRDYCQMLLEGTWNTFLHEQEEEMNREVELAVKRIMKKEGVTEELKKRNPIEWVRRVNGIKNKVESEVLKGYKNHSEKRSCLVFLD